MPENPAVPPPAEPGLRRILSLDGGGIRGIFSLQILARIEELLRESRGRPHLVLADEFHFIAGTSTGAIIAAMLSWGMSVGEIEHFYLRQSQAMFTKAGWRERWKAKYSPEKITAFLKECFSETNDRGETVEAQLGTSKLRTLLLLVMRNATTGSAWPVSNNPRAKYNDPSLPNCNLKVSLAALVRASAAAPTYFPPEQIPVGTDNFIFVDGGITPYNNPALIAALMATLPAFNLNWSQGAGRLRVVSIGTGSNRTMFAKKLAGDVNLADAIMHVIPALIHSVALEQDLLCRVLGKWVGDPENAEKWDGKKTVVTRNDWVPIIDGEIGGLTTAAEGAMAEKERLFGYVRYDRPLPPESGSNVIALDDLRLIPWLRKLGREYARKAVKLEHLGGE